MSAFITGIGIHIPDYIITNSELSESFNIFVELQSENLQYSDPFFMESASGIKARHVLEKSGILDPHRMVPNFPERADSELSVQAEFGLKSARAALLEAQVPEQELDMLICACAQHQRPYPAIAIEIQEALGSSGAAFDMNVACSSTTFGIHTAVGLVTSGLAKNVLVCSPEIMSGHLNHRDRGTHFIFGDASLSVVVTSVIPDYSESDSQLPHRPIFEVVSTKVWTKMSSNIRSNFGFLNRTAPETQFSPDKLVTQKGKEVFRDITILASSFITDFLKDNNLDPEEISRFWLHQANIKIIRAIIKRLLKREMGEETPIVLDKIGNVASPGSLVAFGETRDAVPVGDYGLICSFGAGYSIGAILVKRTR